MKQPAYLSERRAVALGTLATGCAFFALVIWIKLRVVTNTPRTVYAEPERHGTADVTLPGPKAPPPNWRENTDVNAADHAESDESR